MKNKKQILFIGGYNTVMLYKIARAFKKKEYETILIRIAGQNPEDKSFYNNAFEKVIDIDLPYKNLAHESFSSIFFSLLKGSKNFLGAFLKILRLKPYVIIGRAPSSIPIVFFRILFQRYPLIYFSYDIRALSDPKPELLKKYSTSIELKADRFCFEHSDGVIHKGAPEELNYINGRILGDNIKLPENKLSFQPYCSKEFIVPFNKNKLSRKDKEIHLVFVGGVLKPNADYYLSQLKSFEKIIQQKIHLHFYFCSDVSSKKDLESEKKVKESFFKTYKNYPNIKYFHIENSFNAKDIVKEISKYDFGIGPYSSVKESGLDPKFGMGNKISTYLEAGLPAIYGRPYLFINKIMKKYKAGLIWPKNMNTVKKMIKNLDYKKLEKDIEKARENYSMEKNFSKLEKFISKVAESKKKKIH